jgi:DHA2 family multidrug resistance protein
VPPERIPLASGLSNFARITAGGVAASIVTTVWDRRAALHQSRMADHLTLFDPALRHALAGLQAMGLSDLGAKAAVARTMISQAYLLGADDIFWISGWICLGLIGTVWLCRKAKANSAAPAAAD